ncbi:Oidioi.mRNA.OKI2018_I69.chr1.g2744.t1.cds [Oikopleura dioica]|uniref:Oidioi.mRNA.OKI2018_I69.chr1.g2744.t1.cds n=1 Tax=Oikopleura dioica TaxID=34765 RepID=A0ABN7SYF7_OIKDI|nr:Oidioi.mRNA.OKI2018_I69.chr1.g2744.t1.cds [Oikopleura dioica]
MRKAGENDGKAHGGNIAVPRPILKSADFSNNYEEKGEEKDNSKAEKKEDESERGGFLHNEQLITICLAALGVTSTGLLMWIAIQHLYGIYTDFKKTMAPVGYRESSYGDEFGCPEVCSVMSARMADRPPSYEHSQQHFQRENSCPADDIPPTPLPATNPLSPNPGPSTSGCAHHSRQRSTEEMLPPLPDEDDSEWEINEICPDDDFERYSNASQEEFREQERSHEFLQDFESAPELAELEFIHRLIRETGASPKRATSFAHYVDRKVANDGSIVQVINVQIELDKYSATASSPRQGVEFDESLDEVAVFKVNM